MVRMVQALKNLEARGGGGQLAAPARRSATEKAQASAANSVAVAVAGAGDSLPAGLLGEDDLATVRVRPVRRGLPLPEIVAPEVNLVVTAESAILSEFSGSPLPNPFVSPSAPPLPGLAPVLPPADKPAHAADLWSFGLSALSLPQPTPFALATLPPPAAAKPKPQRPQSALERLVLRTLSDPVRSQPLVQLAERLHRDVEQTGSKSLLFVGIGDESAAHETLIYAAPLLTEQLKGDLLLVDADLSRRALSVGLEFGQHSGLSELIASTSQTREFCQPTAVPKLHFLPAGQNRLADLSTAGPRLELLLHELAAQFACVLIDGGRTGDLAAGSLARFTDAAYFVVQLGTVEISAAQAALRDFRAAGARVLGSIAT